MLTAEENEKLTRIEGDAPMGQLIRRFWMPFLLSSDLPGPDCVPVRVRLMGEDLLAFRDTSGRVGLIDPLCAHRRAALFYGRNEEDGLRCIYHGWKYDVTGQCTDAPTEPKDSNFKHTVRLLAYPVEEKAGVCWTYMGPKELQPELPTFEFMNVPESHLYVSWSTQDCNYAQAIEGGIDTMHSVYLHSTLDSHRKLDEYRQGGLVQMAAASAGVLQNQYRNKDNPATLHAVDTDFGTIVGGQYAGDQKGDYWRFNLFYMPFWTSPPGGAGSKLIHAFVPIDDENCARWSFGFNLDKPHSARDIATLRGGSGVHVALIPGSHTPMRNRTNDYLIDREEQRNYTYTGIGGIGEQDFAVQEGMGRIVDRTKERLGVSDVGISHMRKRLLKAADDLEKEGVEPYAASHPEVYRVHAGDSLLPQGLTDWAGHEGTKTALAAKW
jgi:phthalate 4,5-dioxygenase